MKQPRKRSFKARALEAETERDLLRTQLFNARAALGLVANGGLDTDPKVVQYWAGELVKGLDETLKKTERKQDDS
ncbi:hypothetical protein [Vibrio phage VP16C]|nr:hypothetical protein [Vibrio phage VP16C]